MSVPPLLWRAVQYYYQERALPPWDQSELLTDGVRRELHNPDQVASYFFELFVPLAERQRGGVELQRQILEATIPLFAPPTFPFSEQNYSFLTLREQLYYAQCSTEQEMLDLVGRYREETSAVVEEIYNRRRKNGQQPLLSGHYPYEYSAEQLLQPLVEGGVSYIFDRGDLEHLIRLQLNPYTYTPLPTNYRDYLIAERTDWRQALTLHPLEEVLAGLIGKQQWCPLRTSFPYYVRRTPLHPSAPFPAGTGMIPYQQTSWYAYYVYQREEETGRAQLIFDPYRKPPPYVPERPLTDSDVQLAIHNYHNPSHPDFRQIPRSLWPRLEELHFKSEQPLRLYRGLYHFELKVRRGDTFNLSSGRVQSWTTNLCVAEAYSRIKEGVGIVVSAILSPFDILIDSRYIATEQLRKTVDRTQGLGNSPILFMPAQNEVLSKPGTYQVVVERLTYSTLYNNGLHQYRATRDDLQGSNYMS